MIMRIEKDTIGELSLSDDSYYGLQTLRARQNFDITGTRILPEFNRSLAEIKIASATVNARIGALAADKAEAIIAAAKEVLTGKFDDMFITDAVQGGAGTSANMNANEVIANRAIELLGGKKGEYTLVHPNDHVNKAQSTNDVIPTAGKMTALRLLEPLYKELTALAEAFGEKEREFDHIVKMGRTQLQDAVPVRLGQEFGAYKCAVLRGLNRVREAAKELTCVNMGGTAIGTGITADKRYIASIVPELASVSGLPLVQADNLIDGTQNIDCFAAVSGALRACALSLSKISNDLRLLSSGPRTGIGEITLPPRQNGSSIMPGKVNPVIPEVMNQVAFAVAGNDVTIGMAVEAGQMELNAFEPIVFQRLFESIRMMTGAVNTLTNNCVKGIVANEKRCDALVKNSVGIVTALTPVLGYTLASQIAKAAVKKDISLKEELLERGLMTEEEIDKALDVYPMTK